MSRAEGGARPGVGGTPGDPGGSACAAPGLPPAHRPHPLAAPADSHPRLPLDPDAPDAPAAGTPAPGPWRLVAAVAAGGLVGAALRDLVVQALPPDPGRLPWATLLVNVSGAFLLGLLMEVVAERAPAGDPSARLLRHLAGVGLLGAFTTYSTFALETDLSLRAAAALVALGGGAAAVLLGMAAAAAGIAAGRRVPLPTAWGDTR